MKIFIKNKIFFLDKSFADFIPSKNFRGITLIQILIVFLVIGILAGIILRNILKESIRTKDTKRISDIEILANYLAQYLAKQGQFPTSSDVSPWINLNNAFSSAGIPNVNLPVPPGGEPYVYYSCSDTGSAPPTGIANHFIIRVKLDQSRKQAVIVYDRANWESRYPPPGWSCSTAGVPSFDCRSLNRYYCYAR